MINLARLLIALIKLVLGQRSTVFIDSHITKLVKKFTLVCKTLLNTAKHTF